MSASRRFPMSRFQPGIAAMYACTGASPSAFAMRGLPPGRRTTAFSPSRTLIGLASLAIPGHRGLHERLERARVDLLPFVDVDRSSRVAFQAGIEKARWVWDSGPAGEGELHDLRVNLPRADDPVVRPDRNPGHRIRRIPPFPLLD